MTHDNVIQTRDLVKDFGHFRALNGLHLDVQAGEVHGFLGPNGAGKSTTIRILLGLMRSTSGDVGVFGQDPWHSAMRVHQRLAYVPGDVTLWPGLSGGQCIDVLGRSHGGLNARRRSELTERFDLDESKRAREYSKGNRQKVILIAALAADVDLLILDEPTSGLDPLMERVFQDCIRERRNAGCTVLLSSHILGEVEELADRVSIISKGVIVTSGTLAALRQHTRVNVHAVTTRSPSELTGIDGVQTLEQESHHDGAESRFTVDTGHLDQAIGAIHRAGIQTLTTAPPSLDELFLANYEQPDTTGADAGANSHGTQS